MRILIEPVIPEARESLRRYSVFLINRSLHFTQAILLFFAAAIAGRTSVVEDLRQLSWQAIAVSSVIQFLLAVYGGYFGAGIGFVILGMLAALGMRDVLAMGAIRTLLAAACNVAAVVTFIWAGAVLWPQCVVMIAGALTGGWFGAHFAQKADPRKMRYAVIGVGLAMSAYFFVTAH